MYEEVNMPRSVRLDDLDVAHSMPARQCISVSRIVDERIMVGTRVGCQRPCAEDERWHL